MHAIVHAADVQDRDGGALLMASLFGAFPFLVKLYADAGYQGPQFQSAMKRILARVNVEIVKRSDQAKGFVTLPKRWIVERTLAWLGRCRRLAKDWECLNRKALAFLRLASIRLMLRKLCNPSRCCNRLLEFAHQFQRGVLVALGLDQHIQNLALGVDGAPQVNHAPIDFQIDLVKTGKPSHLARRWRCRCG